MQETEEKLNEASSVKHEPPRIDIYPRKFFYGHIDVEATGVVRVTTFNNSDIDINMIYPVSAYLPPGKRLILDLSFKPEQVGWFSKEVILSYNYDGGNEAPVTVAIPIEAWVDFKKSE